MIFKVIIPARKGSKRIPGKNHINLGGKYLINYSIEFALEHFSKEDVWVNTNCSTIQKIAENYGVNLLIRPEELSTDNVKTYEAIKFQHKYFFEHNINVDGYILLQPTNPFRKAEEMLEAIKIFKKKRLQSVFSCSTVVNKISRLHDNHAEPLNYQFGMRSQDISKDLIYENGNFYIFSPTVLEEGNLINKESYPFVCKSIEATIDIDELYDLHIAKSFLKWKE